MMGVLERFRAAASPTPDVARSMTWGDLAKYASQYASFAGHQYPLGLNTTYGNPAHERIGEGLAAYMAAMMQSPPAFGAQLVRSLVLSQAGFRFRNFDRNSKPRYFTNRSLATLQRPWPKGTTGELISKMEWLEGLSGNAFAYRTPDRLYLPRSDWVTIVHGSEMDPEHPQWQLDAELVGYLYHPGGHQSKSKPWMILPDRMAHWSPLPDPLAPERGMSWMTPVIREIESDIAATVHKINYFEKGATPNLVVTGIPAKSQDEFDLWVETLSQQHDGVRNAWKTLYFTSGADATVVGSNLGDLDYKGVQGGSETRISVASRVPAPVLGISEGLAGSSLNAGNFGQARRNFTDIWMYPTLKSLVGCLSQIVDVPDDAELWYDDSDMPILREDAKDAAEIEDIKARTIRSLTDGGFEPGSVVAAVQAQNMDLLIHTGKLSVQLQEPGAQEGNQ